ncbi:hypothetical protein EI77_00797 [Prosthecobacter fusiformis]|uniref:Uncharacterized protein n=1 Tax=Prosthecobacter fusiformis TaxID=48464 RepID=A0A4R7STB3_9BACT|nr:hypothetical protein [Prosthecobacter fusiformis]TDU81488.1 hypothetical protein EI77_00797 [Prosthecobacter fusiformis]
MISLILDFVSRWRWVLGLYMVFVGFFAFTSRTLISIAPMTFFLLFMDAQRGVFYTLRPQPVSRRDQDRAWWFTGVWLLTMLSAPVMAAGLWWRQHEYPASLHPGESPWFALTTVLYLGLGSSALLALLILMLPRQAPETKGQWLIVLPVSAVGGMLMMGTLALPQMLPKTLPEMGTWHWIAAGLLPLLLWLSYVAAPKITRLSMKPARPAPLSQIPVLPPDINRRGYSGWSFLLLSMHKHMLAIIVFMSLAMWLSSWWIRGPLSDEESRRICINLVVYMILFSSFIPDWFSLRMLRTAPLSSRTLALMLLSVPCVQGLLAALQMGLAMGWRTSFFEVLVDSLSIGLFTAGSGALMLTISCHANTFWRFASMIFPLSLMIFEVFQNGSLLPWLPGIGFILLLLSWLLLKRGIWRSSAFYRPRFGLGTNAGQPVGAS